MKILLIVLTLVISMPSFAWTGFDYETSSYVEIEKGNLVSRNKEIQVYIYDTSEYISVTVISIRRTVGQVELVVYDYEIDEYRTFYMQD